MSNALIFYKRQDPTSASKVLAEHEKKAYDSFFKPLNLGSFKDSVKRCRLNFTDPKDKNVLVGWSQRFIIDYVIYPLACESVNGEVKEVKGMINETLKIIFSLESSKIDDGSNLIEGEAKAKILNSFKEILEKAFEEFKKQQETDQRISHKELDCEEEFTWTLNNAIDLLEAIGVTKTDLNDLTNSIQTLWIPYQEKLLSRLVSKIVGEKQFLTKHVDMISDLLRNISSTLNRLGDIIDDKFIQNLLVQVNLLLSNSLRLKKETVSHASILHISILILRNERSLTSVIEETMEIQDANEEQSLQKLSKVRAIFSFGAAKVPFHSYGLLEYITSFLDHSHPELKLYALGVMVLALQTISTSDYKNEFACNDKLQNKIYECVGRTLEYPAKKVSYWIESILTQVISNTESPRKSAEKWATAALALNSSSTKRKYYLLSILYDFLPVDFLINHDPRLIRELMVSCGEVYILPAPALLYKILEGLYRVTCDKDITKWRAFWENDYFESMKTEQIQVVRGMISAVNTILARINKDAIVYMLASVLNEKKEANVSYPSGKNALWIFVSFLKVAKEKNLVIDGKDGSFTLMGATEVKISTEKLEKLILNKDRNVIANILDFISVNPKPSESPSEIEFNLLLLFLKYGTRTSYPEYRKDLLSSFKRFIERLRLVYERDLILVDSGKQPKKGNFNEFVRFIQGCVDIIFSQMYPSMSFEIANPMLEILLLILTNFPIHKQYEYKKGLFIQPSNFLQTQIINPPIFSMRNVECLLVNANSLWESVRAISIQALSLFPPSALSIEYLKHLKDISISLCKSPQIKNYECGASIQKLLYSNYLSMLGSNSVEFISQLVDQLQNSFTHFSQSFLVDWQVFTESLPHGQITALALVLQSVTKETLQTSSTELKQVLKSLFGVLCDILAFTTRVSSENVATVVLDSNQQVRKAELDEEREKQISQIDCRGHVVFDETAKAKNKFLQNMEKILQGNTLVEALEDNGGGEEGIGSENLLVVAFYLISREAGFLFQSISALVILTQKEGVDSFDTQGLSELVNQFFHSLVNIKHLGSIDRISIGLSTMCKAMNEVKNPLLPHLSENLLEKLISHIESNTFKNILRRSAGLPSAVVCLLKAESSGRRSKNVQAALQKLLYLSENAGEKQVKIHSLNILKKVFEDSSLKLEVDKFVGQGFQTAIRGFAIEDWSIRNSSLMLFSALSLRTVGGSKNPNAQTLKSKLNLLEFFTRAPELLDFFKQCISDFVNTDVYNNNQYPPLYPIALLFTRLLPYDLKKQVKKLPDEQQQDDDNDDNNEESVKLQEAQQFIPLAEVQKILPLLIQCANNKNYMGRVMVARSILPFMVFEQIPAESVALLEKIESYAKTRKSHNFTHGILLQILNVLQNYYQMKKEMGILSNDSDDGVNKEKVLADKLQERQYLLIQIKCPAVQYTYLDLIRLLLSNLNGEDLLYAQKLLVQVDQFAQQQINTHLSQDLLRLQDDMGHSVLRKKLLRYLLQKEVRLVENKCVTLHLEYLTKVLNKYQSQPQHYAEEDNEFLRIILKELYRGLKIDGDEGDKIREATGVEQLKKLGAQLMEVLSNENSQQWFFSQCITLILKILYRLAHHTSINNQYLSDSQFQSMWTILKSLQTKFQQNGLLMKELVRFSGMLMHHNCLDIDYFQYLTSCYSSSNQMDYLRIAVIESFKLGLQRVLDVLIPSKQLSHYKTFLEFISTFFRLLQDEVPEVRQKMSTFLQHKLFSSSANGTNSVKEMAMIYEVTIKQVFEYISHQQLDEIEAQRERSLYLLKQCFEMEFFNVKKTNHNENRIFAYDKSNKFIDEMRIKKYAVNALINIPTVLTLQDITQFVQSNNYSFLQLTPQRLLSFKNNFSTRDEFEFENILHQNIYELLLNYFGNKTLPEYKSASDPFWAYFDKV